jgi:hypothetical protein
MDGICELSSRDPASENMNFSEASQLRIPVDVGRDYAMWATITVKQECGPHHTGISGHFTGIRTTPGSPAGFGKTC